jgi:prepilin-type N-terminal cleavage/methylation domain-containing protein
MSFGSRSGTQFAYGKDIMRPRQQVAAGFTVVELLLVVAVIGVASVMAYPALQQFLHRNKILGIAQTTSTLMREARFEAIRRGVSCIVHADGVTNEVVAFADVDGDLTFNPDPTETTFRATDYELRRYRLPAGIAFAAPGAQPPVFAFTNLPAEPWNGAVFQTNGSIRDLGGMRFGDQRGNYLEARVEPAASARVSLRKWDGSNWLAQGEGGKTWGWL